MPLPPRLQLAADHIDAGRLDQAAAALRRFLASDPNHPTANAMMGHTLTRTGELELALYHLHIAAVRDPGNMDLLANLGNTRLTSGDPALAIEAYRRALAIDPAHLPAMIGLGNALNIRSELDESQAVTTAALKRHADEPRLLQNLAMTALLSGRAAEAVDLLARVTTLLPDDPIAANTLAFASSYPAGLTAEAVFNFHKRYGQLMDRLVPPRTSALREPAPDRPLRIGILSGDLRAHAVGFFIRSWLEHRNRDRFSLTCYSTATAEDSDTGHFRALADVWRTVPYLPAADLARTITQDRIDILLDLSGHSSGHRLGIMNLHPAPVQATYLGYPNTTGLRSVDYRLVDSITDPPGSESLSTERLWRLDPCLLCYTPHADSPPVAAAPHIAGPITFGSFHNLAKLNDDLLALYSRVLAGSPGSRIVFKYRGLENPRVAASMTARLARMGMAADRVLLDPPAPDAASTLAAHARIDIMLDSFPFHGATTTCNALFMGVPVVTLAGDRSASRVGVSILTAIGRPDLIAQSPDQFVRIATELAADRARMSTLRTRLRPDMLDSPLCNTRAFALRLEDAFRDMWRQRCAAEPR